uniref:hypothetical protein n=1 Tax=Burkholderia multivorans TaxID=87883 RepID=UPI001C6154E6
AASIGPTSPRSRFSDTTDARRIARIARTATATLRGRPQDGRPRGDALLFAVAYRAGPHPRALPFRLLNEGTLVRRAHADRRWCSTSA